MGKKIFEIKQGKNNQKIARNREKYIIFENFEMFKKVSKFVNLGSVEVRRTLSDVIFCEESEFEVKSGPKPQKLYYFSNVSIVFSFFWGGTRFF